MSVTTWVARSVGEYTSSASLSDSDTAASRVRISAAASFLHGNGATIRTFETDAVDEAIMNARKVQPNERESATPSSHARKTFTPAAEVVKCPNSGTLSSSSSRKPGGQP